MVFLFAALLFNLFILFRNEWVYKKRMEILRGENGTKEHDKLVDYNTMVWKFWIWNVEKFKEKD